MKPTQLTANAIALGELTKEAGLFDNVRQFGQDVSNNLKTKRDSEYREARLDHLLAMLRAGAGAAQKELAIGGGAGALLGGAGAAALSKKNRLRNALIGALVGGGVGAGVGGEMARDKIESAVRWDPAADYHRTKADVLKALGAK